MNETERIQRLNHDDRGERLTALADLAAAEKRGEIDRVAPTADVNNHIHTWYSFSPYSPAKAVWLAHRAGLATAGIMDHDSIAGADEFRSAAALVGLGATSGTELRVSFGGGRFDGRRVNNPDQNGIAYMALHAVPACGRAALAAHNARVGAARGARNRRMVDALNEAVSAADVRIDYDADVLPLSRAFEGGSVTERHILFALSRALTRRWGRGAPLLSVLTEKLGLPVSARNVAWLSDEENPGYEYDVLGVLKGDLVSRFYVDAGPDECPPAEETVRLGLSIGAIPAYAYLGDVVSSVTGDKRPQAFEDGWLDELFDELCACGYTAVTYMPSRNTLGQLARVRRLCGERGLFQISGEDINSPRQSFVCPAARAEEFSNLRDAAYVLIASEDRAAEDPRRSFSSAETCAAYPDLDARVGAFLQRI